MVTGFVCGAQSVSFSNKPLSLVYEVVAKFILRFFQIVMGDKSALTSTRRKTIYKSFIICNQPWFNPALRNRFIPSVMNAQM